jgi:hypothetical protein
MESPLLSIATLTPQMAKVPHIGGFDLLPLVYLGIILAVMLVPMYISRRAAPPDTTDPGSDDGPGRGPRRPRDRPDRPQGGLPLPDAVQSRIRRRDHGLLKLRIPGPRRDRRHDPDRKPVRTER